MLKQSGSFGRNLPEQPTDNAITVSQRRARMRRQRSSDSQGSTKSKQSIKSNKSGAAALLPPMPERRAGITGEPISSKFGLRLERTEATFLGNLMGTARRSEMTGRIAMRGGVVEADNDFAIADFWTRDLIQGLPSDLAQDRYLFRVVPLQYRTWMYHYSYNSGLLHSEASKARQIFEDVDDMFGHVLEQNCIDVPLEAGRWSPAICYVPASMFSVLTADVTFVVGICFAFVLIIAASRLMNTPVLYRYVRLVTLPLRITFLVLTFILALQGEPSYKLFGHILVAIALLIDLLAGDVGQVLDFKHTCSYEVVRSLANRVYICKRLGAGYTKAYLTRPPVDEFISGVGNWDHTYVLLCDLMGIVVELHPMQLEDWMRVMDESQVKGGGAIQYIGLDVYTDECPSAYSLDRPRPTSEKLPQKPLPVMPAKPPPMPELPNALPPQLPALENGNF